MHFRLNVGQQTHVEHIKSLNLKWSLLVDFTYRSHKENNKIPNYSKLNFTNLVRNIQMPIASEKNLMPLVRFEPENAGLI